MYELNDFHSIQISIASPEKIKEWSYGEVTKPETINYRTQKPEKDGLFCERIFGPVKDWECHCGKYKRVRYKGMKCEKCGVEITRSKVRRERMGHITLAAPVSHIWYFRGVPSRIGLVLNMPPKQLENVIYFAAYVILDPGNVPDLVRQQVINDKQLRDIEEKYGDSTKTGLKVGMGAESIRELLAAVDLDKECEEVRKIIDSSKSQGQKKQTAMKRLEILESFRRSGNRPEWMVLTVLPVIPPEIRPMVQLDGGRFATSDLNDLYRRVINRNNRLKKMIEIGAPEIIIKNEKRMLQEAVDALIDNGRHGKTLTSGSNREIKSLSAMLRGKQGRFRQNLLGKRVDYSGRSVIVVGPDLKIYQCGLPKEMALELFKPFVMKELVAGGRCHNIKSAKRYVEKGGSDVWDVLENVIKDHPVLLNRAPTLHRLSIQAFEPVLIEGRAIKISPLVCGPFNADFDGDQMAVHLPLSTEAQAEARFLMLSANNILKLADGKSVMSPTQDMIIGAYYLTILRREAGRRYDEYCRPAADGEIYVPPVYASVDEAVMAYQTKALQCQDEIFVRRRVELPEDKFGDLQVLCEIACKPLVFAEGQDGQDVTEGYLSVKNNEVVNTAVVKRVGGKLVVEGVIKTTVGRIIYNDEMPQDLNFVRREKPEDYLKYELSTEFIGGQKAIGKKHLSRIVEACFNTGGAPKASAVLDAIKERGYKYSTYAALTTSVFDMKIPESKEGIVKKAEATVAKISKKYSRGLMREEERYTAVINTWDNATDEVAKALTQQGKEDKFNPIWMMADSGARGSIDQIKQLAGMRGLMVNPQGKKIEVPVKSCYKKGLSVLEYFISSHGGRKGLADTALKTADSGYLTRRLVDVAQDVIVLEDDCCAGRKPQGMKIRAIINEDNQIVESLDDRLTGRFASADVRNPLTQEIIVKSNEFITADKAKYIVGLVETVSVAEDVPKERLAKYYGRGIAKDIEPVAQQPIAKKGEKLTEEIRAKMLENGITEVTLYLIEEVSIRSIFTCAAKHGVCAKCYGKNMATTRPIKVGEAVGVIAAQSIGEPGTQLTMRTFHTGGIAATGDITQGLPRVEELFEARKPKGVSTLSEIEGVVEIDRSHNTNHIVIRNTGNGDVKEYDLPYNAELKVKDGEKVYPGTQLNAGPKDPQKILSIVGFRAVQEYILEQVQTVYRSQGVEINDKHVEIIIRQMLRKIKVEDPGDTDMLPGEQVDQYLFEQECDKAIENGKRPAIGKRILLGITKASLATESFLSAASFQETSRVLTDAAIHNKRDYLRGLKENVIIGKLIPAGTGLKQYRDCSPTVLNSYASTVDEDSIDDYDFKGDGSDLFV